MNDVSCTMIDSIDQYADWLEYSTNMFMHTRTKLGQDISISSSLW